MKKIFFIGDFWSDTGPGIANKILMRGFSGNNSVKFSKRKVKLSRLAEATIGVFLSENICFCSSSKLNIFLLPVCRVLKRKIFYIQHGNLKYEKELNQELLSAIKRAGNYEQKLIKNCEKVICVSKKSYELLNRQYPQFTEKFIISYNALDTEELENFPKSEKEENLILSLGGGLKIKNNLEVCKAIDLLNNEDENYKYIVVGEKTKESEKICRYPFVTYYENLPRETVLSLMSKASIYIQNSTFETFGLAVIESLYLGCSLLVSKNVGVADLFCNKDFLIDNDAKEIAEKIKTVTLKPNNMELKKSLNSNIINLRNVAKRIYSIILKTEE